MIVERSISLAASADEAWTAVLDFASWFCDSAEVAEIGQGARIQFAWEDGTVRAAVFEEIDPPSLLTFRWLPFARSAIGYSVTPLPQTRVEISLSPQDDGVEVKVVERRLDVLSEAFA